jgi:hypothetical protein
MRYLHLLFAVLRRATRRGRETVTEDRPSEPRRFTQDEFEKNPSSVLRAADADGAAVVTDAAGTPRMRIGATLERPLILD